ncbi:hypothetical protein EDC04DRAFT_2607654 [Pisolithus marmoratus]|nr:hypothetical protein EDC04DRAFT_2607654 [Pisolithus marmoratus]
MPRYQKLVELVVALPETETHVSTEAALPEWALWTWGAKYLPENIHLDGDSFLKALDQLEGERFGSCLQGGLVVLGLGLLLRECSQAQEVEEDDPEVSHLEFLLNSNLGIQRGRMFCVQWGTLEQKKRKEIKNTQEKAETLEDGEKKVPPRECISMFNTVKKLSTLEEAPFMIIPHVGQPHIQVSTGWEYLTSGDSPHHGWGISRAAIQ